MIRTLANSLFLAGSVSELALFHRATRRVRAEQWAILQRILRENSRTSFGEEHGFASIRSAREYQEKVPIRGYEELQPWIDRTAAGDRNVLTRDPVRLFEPTSGSSGATKLIPYTKSVQGEFQRGIRAWIADLYSNFPQLMGGQAYWSVSPVNTETRRTVGGIPIGFDDDTSYVGGWQHSLVKAVMAVPSSIRLVSDIEAFREQTLFHLAHSRNLRLISVWNPTFLSLLLEGLDRARERISARLTADRRREFERALAADTRQERYRRLWPKLGLISCWKGGNAAGPASQLEALFPHSRIQGKGLIATEAFVSFPLIRHEHPVLAIRSHFLEFLGDGSDGPKLAHELECGQFYTVVVTTGGGLYRYRLGDQIQVAGHFNGCPLIRFVGREAVVSDWFGEKLNDAHVARVFREVFQAEALSPAFAMLACEVDSQPPSYVLYIDSPEPAARIDHTAQVIDDRLRENFNYDYARRLGQLGPVRACPVREGADSYLEAAVKQGRKAGDVKLPSLDPSSGWSLVFRPRS
jgi:hypothetical protein